MQNAAQKQDLGQLFEQMGFANNPKAKLLATLMNQQNNNNQQPSEELIRRQKRMRKRRMIEKQALRFLHNKNEQLSQACGACVCWGENTQCPVCQGNGSPGWVDPSEDMFMAYLEPVLARIGLLQDENERDNVPEPATSKPTNLKQGE